MKPVLDAAKTRELEDAAAAQGRPSSVLMESAGHGLAKVAMDEATLLSEFGVLVGRGNNGGDGLVAARVLARAGRPVRVWIVGGVEGLKGEPLRNLDLLDGLPCTVGAFDANAKLGAGAILIDALFGTGLNRAPAGDFAAAIRWMNAAHANGAKVIAADLPSGVQSDTAEVFEPAVEADVTVCFGALKIGASIEPGSTQSGRTVVVDIGLPGVSDAPLHELEGSDVLAWIPKRKPNSHKGTFGHVLVIAGSRGKTGAAAMASLASLRAGVGLVTAASPADALDAVLAHAPELMGQPLDAPNGLSKASWDGIADTAKRMQALVVGPGIFVGEGTGEFLSALLGATATPVLIDADGLNVLSKDLGILKAARGEVVLTPHPGEMARLTGSSTAEVQKHRLMLARDFARTHRVTLVLKGSRTLIARKDGQLFVNPTGNPGMATGGTGDVLSGIIGALLAQGLEPWKAACAGVFVHGRAGDVMARERGEAGLIATDLLEGLGRVWAEWKR